jgi:hypothetical protein
MVSLVQVSNSKSVRRVGLVNGARIDLLTGVTSAYEVVQCTLALSTPFKLEADEQLNYDDLYYGRLRWTVVDLLKSILGYFGLG